MKDWRGRGIVQGRVLSGKALQVCVAFQIFDRNGRDCRRRGPGSDAGLPTEMQATLAGLPNTVCGDAWAMA